MNPTLVGSVAVLIWGASLPVSRTIEQQIGVCAYVGILFFVSGILAWWDVRRKAPIDWSVFRHPAVYGRWAFFVIHEALILSAIGIVRTENVPFVILLNYLWPTAIILSSIWLAGVRIKRPVAFIAGTIIVVSSLTIEIAGSRILERDLFSDPIDRIAYIMALCGAIAWGLYCAISKRSGDASGGGTVVPFFQLTLSLALPLSFFPPFHEEWNLTFWGGILTAVYCFAQFIAYRSWDLGMRKGNVVALSLFADFIPWMSLLAAALIVKVDLGFHTIVSAVALVVGAMVTRLGTR